MSWRCTLLWVWEIWIHTSEILRTILLVAAPHAFYKRKAAQWIEEDSCPDYMIKAEDSLRLEEERVGNYLHIQTKPKLLKVVEHGGAVHL